MRLADLEEMGVIATLNDGGDLLLDAPAGTLTPGVLDRIRSAKPALVAEIRRAREVCEDGELHPSMFTPRGKCIDPPADVHAGWRFHYADRDPLSVWFAPPITHAEALAAEPDAIAAEPITDPASSTSTEAERAELLALVTRIYSDDSEQDRQEAIDAALLDPAGALTCYRSIAAARGIEPDAPNSGADAFVRLAAQTGCRSCLHFRQPGHSSGYCASGRDDLPRAYGANHPLRKLPADGGAGCPQYQNNPRWS